MSDQAAPEGNESSKRKSAQPDLFSVAKSIAGKLSAFSLEDQIQTLKFVQGVLESQLKAGKSYDHESLADAEPKAGIDYHE